jgi:hypothetical protein
MPGYVANELLAELLDIDPKNASLFFDEKLLASINKLRQVLNKDPFQSPSPQQQEAVAPSSTEYFSANLATNPPSSPNVCFLNLLLLLILRVFLLSSS